MRVASFAVRFGLSIGLVAICGPRSVGAQPAYRVTDLPGLMEDANPQEFTEMGGVTYFSAFNDSNGRELWRTDGSADGTRIVRDLQPGPGSSFPSELTVFAGRLFFASPLGLFTSDGTVAGTHRFAPQVTSPRHLTVSGGLLFLSGLDASGEELWKTDGTEAGTVRVKDILAGPASAQPEELTPLGGRVYFTANGSEGRELWRSDGTASGTQLVADINPGPGAPDPRGLAVVAGRLFFEAASPGAGRELWVSDETAGGTHLVADSNPGPADSAVSGITDLGGVAFYTNSHPDSGAEIWRSDGTAAGTGLLKDVRPGALSSSPEQLVTVAGLLFFVADDGVNGFEVWRSDGTAAGTEILRILFEPFNPPPDRPLFLTRYGDVLMFTAIDDEHGPALWRSDGTEAGTTAIEVPPWKPEDLGVAGGTLYLSAENGAELWRSDGTEAGTSRVKVLGAPGGPGATDLTDLNGRAIFAAMNSGVWRSDGTPAATFPITPQTQPSGFGILDGRAYFTTGSLIDQGFGLLWRTDEAATTAISMSGLPGSQMTWPTTVGDRLYFVLNDRGHGREVWLTDGTGAGTRLLKDVNPGESSADARELTAVGSTLFFVADDGVHGPELWQSDGTEAGTTLVRDVQPGPVGSNPGELTAVGSELFFAADDGVAGRELWKSDGTAQGTSLVKDIYAQSSSAPYGLIEAGGLLFFGAVEPSAGVELWRSDGTEAGTQLVVDLWPGATGYGRPTTMGSFGGRLIFTGEDGVHGRELWSTDGTAAGTVLVKDVEPGPDSGLAFGEALAAQGGLFFFRAFAPETGFELWYSDGTTSGTRIVQDVNPGPASAGLWNPPVAAGNHVYFGASDGRGPQLWAVRIRPDLTASPSVPEGTGGTAPATVTVTAAPALLPEIVAGYATRPGTATEGVDYLPVSGALTFSAGVTSQAIALPVVGDALDEFDETLFFDFTVPLGPPTTSLVTILDDDPEPRLAVSDASVQEGDTGATAVSFTAMLSEPSGREVVGQYGTDDFTAFSPYDYELAQGALTFAPGQTRATFSVNVNGDTVDEPNEWFRIRLFADYATIPDPTVDVMIRDDDGAAIALGELTHGQDRREDLAGPLASDLYLLERAPYTSYEVLLDGASGDVGDADGPGLERLALMGTFVVQDSTAVGTGHARSLRVLNPSSTPARDYIRVRSRGCTTDCGADDVYFLRVRETTCSIARFNNTGGQRTVLVLRNDGTQELGGNIHYWFDGGAHSAHSLAIPARRMVLIDTSVSVGQASGSITIQHFGQYGQLTGKAMTMDAVTGFSFDTPLVWRPH